MESKKKFKKTSKGQEKHERLNDACKNCKYDNNNEGGYFCLSCVLIGKFTPHIEK